MVMSLLYQLLLPRVPAVTVRFAVGADLSIITVGEVNVAVLPAASVTVTPPLTSVPSTVNTSGLALDVEATPERLSVAVKANETSLLFQPAVFGAGLAAPNESVGRVASRLMMTEFDALPPALVAEQVRVTPPVSAVVVLAPHPDEEAMLDSASLTF